MDISGGAAFALLAIAGIAVLLVAIAGVAWMRRGGVAAAPQAAARPPTTAQTPDTFVHTLRELHASDQWDELWRLLDRTLPEWPVSSSLIEVSRAIATLETDLAALPGSTLSSVVAERLTAQTQALADSLWSLADRIVVADRTNSALLREQLAREDDVLLRLLPAVREARTELVELTMLDERSAALRQAEGRFRALADTARELQTLA